MYRLYTPRTFNAQRSLHRKFVTTSPAPKKMDGIGEDPRPPWVYVGTRLISLAVIPAIGVYSIFLYDFGDQEHVFQPIRRWATSVLGGFFTLSPAEQKLLKTTSDELSEKDTRSPKA